MPRKVARKILRQARRAPAIASLPRAWRPKPIPRPVVIDGAHAMELAKDPEKTARVAGLRHVDDEGPGIRRIGTGKSFRYLDQNGRALRDPDVLGRIRSLAIPPAWTDVWICPVDSGHIQATGRDARGRKQYRYHPRWRAVRDETKYHRMITFGEALTGIRARIEKDLALPGLPREKVLATVLRLLDTTLIRSSLRTSMDRCWNFSRRKEREGGSRRRADCATRKTRCLRSCEGGRSDRARFAYFFFLVRARVMMRTGVPSKPKRSRSWLAR